MNVLKRFRRHARCSPSSLSTRLNGIETTFQAVDRSYNLQLTLSFHLSFSVSSPYQLWTAKATSSETLLYFISSLFLFIMVQLPARAFLVDSFDLLATSSDSLTTPRQRFSKCYPGRTGFLLSRCSWIRSDLFKITTSFLLEAGEREFSAC
jgi:hypothetical protein